MNFPAAADPDFNLARIRRVLGAAEAPSPQPQERHAAVALVLAGGCAHLHLCLIRRAEHAGDPWSGHMALPGGRADSADPSPRAAAERETWEEVGLRLEGAHLLGALPEMPVHSRGVPVGMQLYPFAFYLGAELPAFAINAEVAEAFWVPLAHLADKHNGAQHRVVRQGVVRQAPAIRMGDHVVWGLTYRVLVEFFGRLGRTLPAPR